MKKADWEGFSADLDSNIEEVDAILENYERFVEMLRMTSRKQIPRGYRLLRSADYMGGETRVHFSVIRQGRFSLLKKQRKQSNINNMYNKQ